MNLQDCRYITHHTHNNITLQGNNTFTILRFRDFHFFRFILVILLVLWCTALWSMITSGIKPWRCTNIYDTINNMLMQRAYKYWGKDLANNEISIIVLLHRNIRGFGRWLWTLNLEGKWYSSQLCDFFFIEAFNVVNWSICKIAQFFYFSHCRDGGGLYYLKIIMTQP